jgi:hypothetical protein
MAKGELMFIHLHFGWDAFFKFIPNYLNFYWALFKKIKLGYVIYIQIYTYIIIYIYQKSSEYVPFKLNQIDRFCQAMTC